VSRELRRRRLEDEASVIIEALSVRILLAVAVVYVAGCPPLALLVRWDGTAEAGGEEEEGGNWWWKWEVEGDWWLLFEVGTARGVWLVWFPGAARRLEGAVDCMVVSVVVRDRTEGAGDENVLPSPPPAPRELTPPPNVAVVPALEWAFSELTVSGLVAMVGAADLLLMVGGFCPSLEPGRDVLLCKGEV